jgi:hypothetical protein
MFSIDHHPFIGNSEIYIICATASEMDLVRQRQEDNERKTAGIFHNVSECEGWSYPHWLIS